MEDAPEEHASKRVALSFPDERTSADIAKTVHLVRTLKAIVPPMWPLVRVTGPHSSLAKQPLQAQSIVQLAGAQPAASAQAILPTNSSAPESPGVGTASISESNVFNPAEVSLCYEQTTANEELADPHIYMAAFDCPARACWTQEYDVVGVRRDAQLDCTASVGHPDSPLRS